MGASLGTLTLDVVARTGSFTGPMDRAARAAAKQAAEIERSQRQAAKAIDSTLQDLRQQVSMLGMTANEQRLYRLEMQGATRSQLEQARASMATIDAFERQRLASLSGSDAMGAAGMSARQYQQAIRMLPMQITDVVTSVASGMPIWMVAIQQGGQVRDSFGGIGNAARAVVSTLGPMNLAIGGAAAMLGALLLTYQQGQNEAQAYEQALIMTGNASGASADQLAMMAERIDAVSGTQHQAAAALAEIASTSRFTADQIEAIGSAAVAMENATGKAVSDTVKDFVRLADEPASASAKLNEQYGYLTASVYEQIAALEEQGQETEAAKLATDTFASAMQKRSSEIEGNLGTLERALNSLKKGWKEMWDSAFDIGRPDTLEEQLADVERKIQQRASSIYSGSIFDAGPDSAELDQQREELQLSILERDAEAERAGIRARASQAAIEAEKEIGKLRELTMSKTEKRDKEREDYLKRIDDIRAANPFSEFLDQSKIDKDLAAIDEKYKETVRKAKAYTDDAATRMIQQLSEQEASLESQLSTNKKLTDSQREQAKFAQMIADLGEKRVLTADQKSLLANKDAITAQLAQNAALEQQIKHRDELNQQAQWLATLQDQIATRQNAADISVLGIGMGDKARQELEQINAIQQQYARQREELARAQGTPNALSDDLYQARIEALKEAQEEEIAIVQDANQRKKDAEGNWMNGASRAWQNYLDDQASIASQSEQLFGSAFTGMESAVMGFVTTGKLSFADLKRTFVGTAMQMLVRWSIAQVSMAALNAFTSTAAIPFIGPLSAPAAAASALGATGSFADTIASVAGMAHSGIDAVPETGTWLLQKGERVTTAETSAKLDRTLEDVQRNRKSGGSTVNIIEDASKAGRTETRTGPNGEEIIDVFISNLMEDGRVHKAMTQKYGLRGVGR